MRLAAAAAAPPPSPPPPCAFAALGVPARWSGALRALGAHAPTPIQLAALPALFAGRDAVLTAETGTGKTLAYLLPCVEALMRKLDAVAADGDGDGDVDGDGDGGGDGAGAPARRYGSGALLPAALVLVPTVDLAEQVAGVAASLLPPAARELVRVVAGARGLSRREAAGLLVATPRALREHVNFHALDELQLLVLDEADMLLSGHYVPDVQGYVLATFKQRMPEARPQHVFVAATMPSRGASAGAFLERYYPPPGVMRIATAGVHAARHRSGDVAQVYLQIDAALPPTASEREAAARLQHRAAAAAAGVYRSEDARRVAGAAAGGGEGGGVGIGGGGGGGVAAEGAGNGGDAAVSTKVANGGNEGDSASGDDVNEGREWEAEEAAGGDALTSRMSQRAREDAHASLRAEDAERSARLEGLRRHALLEALLLPAAAEAAEAVEVSCADALPAGSAPPSLPSEASLGAAAPLSKRGRRSSSTLGLGTSAPPAASHAPAAPRLPLPRNYPPDEVVPLGLPAELRARLSAADVALVPPTIVFVNSVASADATRRFLAAALAPIAEAGWGGGGGADGGGSGRSGGATGVRVAALHARVDAVVRAAALRDFASGAVRVLVATNVASRGLDTLGAAHVIQADFALDAVSHMHRVGRTGRAGRQGRATSLLTRTSLDLVRALLDARGAGRSIEAAFSRSRSFRRGIKRDAVRRAEDAAVMDVLMAEQEELQRGGGTRVMAALGARRDSDAQG